LYLKKKPIEVFQRLVELVGGKVSPSVATFIMYVQNHLAEVEGGRGEDGQMDASWVKHGPKIAPKFAAAVPRVIEAQEKFETVELATLETKLDVKYRHLLRRSVSRDFRLKVEALASMDLSASTAATKKRKRTSKKGATSAPDDDVEMSAE
jgi:hypothetical protein